MITIATRTRAITLMGVAATLGIAAWCPSAAQAEEITAGSPLWPVAQQLIANERNAWLTYSRRELEANGRLLAEDYRDLQTDGTVLDRAGHLAFVPQANLEWHELDEFHVFMLSADAALVTYRARSRDRGVAGLYQAACTSGWSRRGKRWLNTFYRETPVATDTAQQK